MNPEQSSPPESLAQTKIAFGAGELTITLDEARRIARALDSHLRWSRHEIAKTMPPDLLEALPNSAREVWIDQRGKVHVDQWLLESRRDRLMLVWYAMPSDTVTYRYIAYLNREKGLWKVLSIVVQTIG